MKLIINFALALTVGTATAQSPAVLKQMDDAAAKFKSAQADVKYENYVAPVHATDVQTGKLYIERKGASLSMGAIYFDPGGTKPAKIINYDGGILHMFTPGTNQDDQFKAGDNRGKYESFLTLGFGGSGTDLARAWNIKDNGSKEVEGVTTEELDLVSKDPSVQSTFTHVTIWVDLKRGVSIKQIFYAPGGDKRTATYTNFDINPKSPINKKPYAIKGAKVISH